MHEIIREMCEQLEEAGDFLSDGGIEL